MKIDPQFRAKYRADNGLDCPLCGAEYWTLSEPIQEHLVNCKAGVHPAPHPQVQPELMDDLQNTVDVHQTDKRNVVRHDEYMKAKPSIPHR